MLGEDPRSHGAAEVGAEDLHGGQPRGVEVAVEGAKAAAVTGLADKVPEFEGMGKNPNRTGADGKVAVGGVRQRCAEEVAQGVCTPYHQRLDSAEDLAYSTGFTI